MHIQHPSCSPPNKPLRSAAHLEVADAQAVLVELVQRALVAVAGAAAGGVCRCRVCGVTAATTAVAGHRCLLLAAVFLPLR